MEWLIGMGVLGVWSCAYSLSKIGDTNAAMAKNMGGLGYQLEQMETRLATITSELHYIKHNTQPDRPSSESWWARKFDGTSHDGEQ